MKKQLFITIPDSPKPNKQQQRDQELIKNRSMESVSSDSPCSPEVPNKNDHVVEFEQFKIDQPQTVYEKNAISPIEVQLITPKEERDQRNYPCKQPPAPSKGSSKTKVFEFPGQAKQAINSNSHSDLQKQLQQCKKQLLFKDGQISMLERFISKHLDKSMDKSPSIPKDTQKLIQKKDEKIEQLLEKVKELASVLNQRNQQYSNLKYENSRLRSEVESLQNEAYILSTKLSNREYTRQFNEYKTGEERQLTTRFSLKADPSKNIDELQKRLDHLKTNNLELEISKTRMSKYNKDSLWVSQTSTNKDKRTIDFRPDQADRRRHIKHY